MRQVRHRWVSWFLPTFVGAHLVAIILHIHQQSSFTKLSFKKQKQELLYEELLKEKQRCTTTLYALHDHKIVKDFATAELGMKSMKLSQIKKIQNHDNCV